MASRQIVLDTETTGLEPAEGHRIIEVGCVELINRRRAGRKQWLINPERSVDAGALAVHGLDNETLKGKPVFSDVATEILEFISGAELVIHNADFDVGFLNHEFGALPGGVDDIRDRCGVLDTLALARGMHPGQRNGLDALCKRYHVDNSKRELHGALLDADLLAEVYLAMTGGQATLKLGEAESETSAVRDETVVAVERSGLEIVVVCATSEETSAHEAMLKRMAEVSDQVPVWNRPSADQAEVA